MQFTRPCARALAFATALLPLLTGCLARGGDAASPAGMIQAHVSIASLPKFFAGMDRLTVLATQDTRYATQPGVVTHVLRSHLVIPTEGWHEDQPMHLIFLTGRPTPHNMVMTLRVDSLDAFILGLESGGIDVQRHDDGTDDRPYIAFADSNGNGLTATAIDATTIAMGSSIETIGFALDLLREGAWSLSHDPNADLSVTLPMTSASENPMRQAMEQIARTRSGMMAEMERMRFNPRAAEMILDAAESMLPALGDELLAITSFSLDCRFEETALGVDIRINPREASFFQEMGERLSRQDGPNPVPSLPATAHWAAAVKQPTLLLPGLKEALTAAAPRLDWASAEDGDDKNRITVGALLALADQAWDMAGGEHNGVVRCILRTPLPVASFLPVWEDLVRDVNQFLAASILDPELRFGFVPDTVNDASEAAAYRLAFHDPEHIDTLLKLLRIGNPAISTTREGMERYRITISGDSEKTLVAVGPNNAKGETMEAPAMTDGSPAALTQYRQGGVLIAGMDPVQDWLFVAMLHELVSGMDPGHASLHTEAWARALPQVLKTGEVLCLSLGANNDRPVLGLVIPYRSLGAALHNYELFIQSAGSHSH